MAAAEGFRRKRGTVDYISGSLKIFKIAWNFIQGQPGITGRNRRSDAQIRLEQADLPIQFMINSED